jgi:predicted nucleic acid-binding protein
MTILDAAALLAAIKGEPAALEVRALIEREPCSLTATGVTEVADHLIRVVRVEEDDAILDLEDARLDPPVELDAASAVQAGILRARHYHRKTRIVSLADCVAAQAARASGSPLATSDPHLLDLCHDEGIAVIPLPDRRGKVWSPG